MNVKMFGEVESLQFGIWLDLKGEGEGPAKHSVFVRWKNNELMKRKAQKGSRLCPEDLVYATHSLQNRTEPTMVSIMLF